MRIQVRSSPDGSMETSMRPGRNVSKTGFVKSLKMLISLSRRRSGISSFAKRFRYLKIALRRRKCRLSGNLDAIFFRHWQQQPS